MPLTPNAQLTQTPGLLDITMTKGDNLAFNIDFNIDLTGYTFVAKVVFSDKTTAPFTIVVSSYPNGILALSIDDSVSSIFPVGEMTWYFSWTGPTPTFLVRKVLAGKFTVIEGG